MIMDYEKKYKVQKILSEIATRKLCTMDEHMAFYNDNAKEDYRFLSEIEEFIKALQKEPVSDDLEEAAEAWCHNDDNTGSCDYIGVTVCEYAFKAGAKWKKEQMMSKAIDAKLLEGHLIRLKGITHPLHVGDKVKVIIIKED